MSRMKGLPVDTLTGDAKKLVEAITGGPRGGGRPLSSFLDDDGALKGPWDPLLRSPELGYALQALGEAVRFKSSLPDQIRELAILVCARHWRANYEWFAHAAIARKAGLPEAIIEAVMAKAPLPTGEGPESAAEVYAFARVLNETGEVDAKTYAAALDVLGEQRVVEVTITVGYYGLISKLLNTFEMPVPKGELVPFPR